jgi:hypothetical protein
MGVNGTDISYAQNESIPCGIESEHAWGGSTTRDEEDRNFGERWQGRSESEISGSIGKTEKGDIIAAH